MQTKIYAMAIAVLLLVGFLPVGTEARQAVRINDDEAERVLERIEEDADAFRAAVDEAIERGVLIEARADELEDRLERFETATDWIRRQVDDAKYSAYDAATLLSRAALIDLFMGRAAVTPRAQAAWARLRADLDLFAVAYNLHWQWDGREAPGPGERAEDLLARLEATADEYRDTLEDLFDDSRFEDTRLEQEILGYIAEFERATDRLKASLAGTETAAAPLAEVLERGARIDAFMREHAITPEAQFDWVAVRLALDDLAGAYGAPTSWEVR